MQKRLTLNQNPSHSRPSRWRRSVKAITEPSPLITGLDEVVLPLSVPALLTLTSCVAGLSPSVRAKTSSLESESKPFATKSLAKLEKAITEPSSLITGSREELLPLSVPAFIDADKLRHGINCRASVQKTSDVESESKTFATKSLALLSKAITEPSRLITGLVERPFTSVAIAIDADKQRRGSVAERPCKNVLHRWIGIIVGD